MQTFHHRYDLKNKVAIVTGGTSGIGRATTYAFVEAGARVLFTGRNQQAASDIEAETGGKAVFLPADQRSAEDMKQVVDRATELFGRIDVLYANAGVEQKPLMISELDNDEIDRVLNTNLRGTIQLVRNALPELIKTQGSIVLCSSFWGQRAGPGVAVYAASKAAVSHFARCLAVELGEHKIRVNTVSPGGVDTTMFRRVLDTQQARDFWARDVPLNRAADPEEMAEAVLWLSDAATYVNGQDLVVDGGLGIKMAGLPS